MNNFEEIRHIAQAPERILDAPDLMDDYYLKVLDWSSQNILAIGLGSTVFFWNGYNSEISELCTLPDPSYICSISFTGDGNYLAVGTSEAEVQIFDVTTSKQMRRLTGHQARVGALDWNRNILSSGSRDTSIINHDFRIKEHIVNTFQNHMCEVCGVKWNQDGDILASGGNDHLLNIWDINAAHHQPKFIMNHHDAGVKALAWCPFQSNLLATGGGSQDRMLRFWNTTTGVCLNSIDTESQVSSIVWSKNYRELVTSHGFTQNQLTVWNYPSMTKVAELTGHQSRVIDMTQSPDGETVVSAAGDETLRFWKIFENQDKSVNIEENINPITGREICDTKKGMIKEEEQECLILKLFDKNILQSIFIQLIDTYSNQEESQIFLEINNNFILVCKEFYRISKQNLFYLDGLNLNIPYDLYLRFKYLRHAVFFNNSNIDQFLRHICGKGFYNSIDILIENNADINSNKLKSPLIEACLNNKIKTTKHLLSYNNLELNFQNQSGYTALITACEKGYQEIVSLLVSKENINLNLTNYHHETALDIATRKSYQNIVEILTITQQN